MKLPREVGKWVLVGARGDSLEGVTATFEHFYDYSTIVFVGVSDEDVCGKIRTHLGSFSFPPEPEKCGECGKVK